MSFTMQDGSGSSAVKSAERTMDVLELLAQQQRPLAAMTIARRCGIPKSSTYHLLSALRARRFVAYHEVERGWTIGERVRQLGASAATIGEAVAVLDAFDSGPHGLAPAELSRRSRLHVAAVGRTLEALAREGLVTTHEDGSFTLGVRIVSLSARLGPIERLRLAARPALVALRDATGETANVLIREGSRAVYLDQVESTHALRHAGWAGRAVPLGVSAVGAALTGDGEVRVVSDAVEPGVTAIACGIDAPLAYAAAVSVTGPSARLHGEHVTRARVAVAEAAERIGRELADVQAVAGPPSSIGTRTPSRRAASIASG